MKDAKTQRLWDAVQQGDALKVRRALAAGAGVDARNDQGQTPLLAAGAASAVEVAAELVKAGADLKAEDKEGKSAVDRAAEHPHPRMMLAISHGGADINRKDRSGQTALFRACATGDPALVNALLSAGADRLVRDATDATILHCPEGLVTSRSQRGPALDLLRALLAAGADVNAQNRAGRTPLMVASAAGLSDAVAVLLQAAANPNLRDA